MTGATEDSRPLVVVKLGVVMQLQRRRGSAGLAAATDASDPLCSKTGERPAAQGSAGLALLLLPLEGLRGVALAAALANGEARAAIDGADGESPAHRCPA